MVFSKRRISMLRVSVRLARRRWRAAAVLAACALAAAAAARFLAPPDHYSLTEFPRVSAARLAHLLADISAHTLTVPGSWTLEEEASNFTSWRYSVSYACGARCAGRAAVQAHEQGAVHRVLVAHERCSRPPLLPWPLLCDEMETESVVTSTGSETAEGSETWGARLEQWTRARCGTAAALLAHCASRRDLRRADDALLRRLQDQLHNRDQQLAR